MSIENPTKYDRYRLKDVEAYRKRKRDWARTEKQREKRKEYMRVWRSLNRKRHNELGRQSYQKNKHKHTEENKNRHYLRKYGITLSEKNEMVSKQGNKCLICKNEFKSSQKTHLDHCHLTGKIRGVLCHICNTKLGWFERYREEIIAYTDTTW